MKKILTTDRERIWRELASLRGQRLNLALLQPKTPPRPVRIENVEEAGTSKQRVVLAKLAEFTPLNAPIIVINPRPRKTTLGFQSELLKDLPGHLLISFPTELFEIERRRFPRFGPERASSVSFVTQMNQKITKAEVKDISEEGARISGPFMLNQDEIIPDLTFTLRLPYSHMETAITVSNARVARIITRTAEATEYGLFFQVTGPVHARLTDYLRMFGDLGGDEGLF